MGVPAKEKESKKILRERENKECIGGLRSPWRSVRKVKGAVETGYKVSSIIQRFIGLHPELLQAADGDPNFTGSDPELVDALRTEIAAALGATSTEPGISGL